MEEDQIIKGNNEFSIEIFQAMKTPEDNAFFSPLSIYTLLSMVFAGAGSITEKQIKSTLHITLDQNRYHTTFKKLLSIFQRNTGSELSMANLLCVHENYKLLERYLWIVEDNYSGGIWNLNFNAITETCSKINKWVADQTQGKITDVIHTIKKEDGLVLVNAIYFKGTWDKEFKERDTEDKDFTLISGEKIKIPMMFQKDRFRWLNEDGFQILEMPYKGARISGTLDHISMVVFLPEKVDGTIELERILTCDKVNSYINKLYKVWEREIKVLIPKFKIERKYELLKALYDLGMTSAFSDGADFSRIAEDPPRHISQIIHKTFIEVNEQGTEAAAVTAVVMLGAAMNMTQPEEFRADHPFIFLLIDSYTKAILFMGRVMNPKS